MSWRDKYASGELMQVELQEFMDHAEEMTDEETAFLASAATFERNSKDGKLFCVGLDHGQRLFFTAAHEEKNAKFYAVNEDGGIKKVLVSEAAPVADFLIPMIPFSRVDPCGICKARTREGEAAFGIRTKDEAAPRDYCWRHVRPVLRRIKKSASVSFTFCMSDPKDIEDPVVLRRAVLSSVRTMHIMTYVIRDAGQHAAKLSRRGQLEDEWKQKQQDAFKRWKGQIHTLTFTGKRVLTILGDQLREQMKKEGLT